MTKSIKNKNSSPEATSPEHTEHAEENNTDPGIISTIPAGFFRRIASWVYDFLTAVAIAMLTTALATGVVSVLASNNLVSLEGYKDVGDYLSQNWIFRGYVIGCLAMFFSWFWTHGGQTVGMRAWRLQLRNIDNGKVTWGQALIRFIASLGGLGNIVVLFDIRNKQSLQDYLSNTRMYVLTKDENHRLYREIKN